MNLTSLRDLRAGASGVVREVHGGHAMTHRLAEMGILRGVTVRKLRGNGPAILDCRGHRLIVGRGMIGDIMVEPLNSH
ncbi:MAG: ferrous iron transport protein A [Lentisphaerae bacterium]|nr:ferrous iron transport protein A [Lentisphaerota bacterium]